MKESILIVDADPQSRGTIRLALQEAPSALQITEAQDAEDGLGKTSRQKFDLAIVSSKLAHVRDVPFLQLLASLDSSVRPRKILLVTESAAPPTGIPAGIACIARPFNAPTLLNRVEELLGRTGQNGAKTKMDAEFIAPFIEGAHQVLRTLASMEAKREAIYLRKQDQPSGDVSAVVALNSANYQGSMAVSFEERCFLRIVSQMLGEEFGSLTPEIQDAAGEICNQIFGHAKTKLNSKGHTLQRAIPAVLAGKNHVLKHAAEGPCLVVKFATEAGAFTVETVVCSK